MNRGLSYQDIFQKYSDYEMFIKLLAEGAAGKKLKRVGLEGEFCRQ